MKMQWTQLLMAESRRWWTVDYKIGGGNGNNNQLRGRLNTELWEAANNIEPMSAHIHVTVYRLRSHQILDSPPFFLPPLQSPKQLENKMKWKTTQLNNRLCSPLRKTKNLSWFYELKYFVGDKFINNNKKI